MLVAAAAEIGLSREVPGCYLLAAAVGLLLAAGIRNSWDTIVFFVTRSREPP